ncbi:MAG: hypothetical protein JHC93_07900 [Parachlamydiales bacterium]|nr:hypothetical protein [Parachlamydiales bacterium]
MSSNALNLSSAIYCPDEIFIANVIQERFSSLKLSVQSYGTKLFAILGSKDLSQSVLKCNLYRSELQSDYNIYDTYPEVLNQRDINGNHIIKLIHYKHDQKFNLYPKVQCCLPKIKCCADQILN